MEVTVTASSRAAALSQAVTLGVDAALAGVVCPGTLASAQARRNLPDTLARLVRVLQEDTGPQGVTLTAEVILPQGAAERAVLRQHPVLSQLRFLVLLPERVLERPVPVPAAEQEVSRAFRRAGLTLTDLAGPARLRERERLRYGQGSATDPSLQLRLGTDVLVTGDAVAQPLSGPDPGGNRTHQARLEFRIFMLDSSALGRKLHSQTFRGTGNGATTAAAGRVALCNAGRAAGEMLPGTVLRALQPEETGPRRFVLRLEPPLTFGLIDALLSRRLPTAGLTGTTVHSLSEHGAVLDLDFSGQTSALAVVLETAGLTVTGINGLELVAHVRAEASEKRP